MIRALLSLYEPSFPRSLVYMLQNSEYKARPYLQWFWRTADFSKVEYRRQLVKTKAARLLLLALRVGIALQILLSLALAALWAKYRTPGLLTFAVAVFLSYPLVWAHLVVVPLVLGRGLVVTPRNRRKVKLSEQAFHKHEAEKIAIVGSYGKTSMKELLLTVLGEKLKVAATPANKNVATSHAAFASMLAGDEDVLLIEYGEGAPGDVANFARITHPTRAIITGVAAAHLDQYGSTQAAGDDIFSVTEFIANKSRVYVNEESPETSKRLKDSSFTPYSRDGALDWAVSDVIVAIDGVAFTMTRYGQTMKVKSHLLGRHNIGPLSLVAALAHEFGFSTQEVQAGIAKAMPFEHRMQPYQLNGAWIIDDTYNGNIEGIRAGTELLKELPSRRKLYVTPGLVDQGDESQAIHEEMGRLIADSGANVVVLMKNSVTDYIKSGLEQANFRGELRVEDKPLEFYTNLGQFVAAGDLVMLQNDWPDNYR